MSDNCYIATAQKDLAVYLHWHGDIGCVAPFLKYCELQGYVSPEYDSYGWSRLCQVIGNYIDSANSVGIEVYNEANIKSNRTFIIKDWRIVGKDYNNPEHMNLMLQAIDEMQPEYMQLKEYVHAQSVLVSELKIGEQVYIRGYVNNRSRIIKATVVGFGEEKFVNGTMVKGMPYVDNYQKNGDYSLNINNYITAPMVYKVESKKEQINPDG